MAKLIITIDGPAGSGKSSTAKLLAAKLGAAFLDTGAMYRAATLAVMNNNGDFNDVSQIEKIIDSEKFEFAISDSLMNVKINGEDVTEKIRDPQVTANVKFVASQSSLRDRLVKLQREFAAKYEKIVTEGRDQGTVVFPDANLKLFLTASNARRAERRAKELAEKGYKVDVSNVKQEIDARDFQDISRKVAPLAPAADSIVIDNSNMTLQQAVDSILEIIKKQK